MIKGKGTERTIEQKKNVVFSKGVDETKKEKLRWNFESEDKEKEEAEEE